MTAIDGRPVLRLPAREIPVPASVSPQAQAMRAMPQQEGSGYPALDDVAGWKATVAERDAMLLAMLQSRPVDEDTVLAEIEADGASVYVITPPGAPDDGRVYLDIHGGALL